MSDHPFIPAPRARISRTAIPVIAALTTALLSGCSLSNRDSITVGAIPDDYRTNHPIVISDKEEVLDLPVSAGDRGMTQSQRATLEGFLYGYDRSAAPTLSILAPAGSVNEIAASHAVSDFIRTAKAAGVPANRIVVASYSAGNKGASAPIRVSYTAMKAHTDKCGRWPEDLTNTHDNKHYANFGCSYQNNLAAQVANPADLLGPRKPTPIDAQNRSAAIGVYQNRGISGEFLGTSEVNY